MLAWLLPTVIFVTWILMFIGPAVGNALEDIRNPLPDGGRRGVSILPGFPLFPLLAWGMAAVIDQVVAPWGTYVIGGLHCIMFIWVALVMIRDINALRRMNGEG